jgi:hypothetical protein
VIAHRSLCKGKKSENENTHCIPTCKKRKLNASEVFSFPARKTPDKKKKTATIELIHSWKKTKKEGGVLLLSFFWESHWKRT